MRFAACVLAAGLTVNATPVSAGHGSLASGTAWLFFIDDLHIDFRATGLLRRWMLSLVSQLIQDGDVFAARSTGPSSLSVGWLAGVEDLDQGIRRLSGNSLNVEPIRHIPEALDEVGYRARVSMRAATEFLATAPADDPRRRVMVYVGKGFDADDTVVDEAQAFLSEAWRLDVTLIAVDVATLSGARATKATRSSLDRLALPTRGFVLADEDAISNAATRISIAVRGR